MKPTKRFDEEKTISHPIEKKTRTNNSCIWRSDFISAHRLAVNDVFPWMIKQQPHLLSDVLQSFLEGEEHNVMIYIGYKKKPERIPRFVTSLASNFK